MDRRANIHHGCLYLVLSEAYGNGRNLLDIARLAIAGGVDLLQMREKDKSPQALLTLGTALSRLCRDKGVIFIVNDNPRLAVELDADGVHMGQEDLLACGVDKVRHIVGPHRMIGVSTHNPGQFQKALAWDVDYLAFGPVFQTRTKDYHIGTEAIDYILSITSKPVFFIGGIKTSNLDILIDKGATNVALIRDIMEAKHVDQRARWYKRKLRGQRGFSAVCDGAAY